MVPLTYYTYIRPEVKLEALVVITGLSEYEDENLGFELKEETVAVLLFPKHKEVNQ